VDLASRSGGNAFHGSAYYYVRNEAFAAASPFSETKKENRNHQFGFSFGGPFIKNRLFFFTTFEKQKFTIGLPGLATEPSAAYQAQALAEMAKFGVPENPVSANLIDNLWPSYAMNGAATPNNYSSPDPEYGYSYNGLAKLDFKINDMNTFSFHYFIGQGNQVAPVGSAVKDYYEVAPLHVSNYAAAWNSTFSPRLSNQLLSGVNYFHQIFSDFNANFDLSIYGLNLYDGFNLPGAPNIAITGFDSIGLTPPEGREDITGHLTDVLSYTVGKHQFRFGGEFRRAQLEEFYHRHALGTFVFDGSQGPWAGDPGVDSNVLPLADFLAGDVSRSSIAVGDPTRLVFVKTLALFAQDSWQVNPRLSLNYGLRWDYEGPVGNDKKDLSVFVPSKGGLVFEGDRIDSVYPKYYKNFSPRVGFAYKLGQRSDFVIRGGFGIYFDTPNLNVFPGQSSVQRRAERPGRQSRRSHARSNHSRKRLHHIFRCAGVQSIHDRLRNRQRLRPDLQHLFRQSEFPYSLQLQLQPQHRKIAWQIAPLADRLRGQCRPPLDDHLRHQPGGRGYLRDSSGFAGRASVLCAIPGFRSHQRNRNERQLQLQLSADGAEDPRMASLHQPIHLHLGAWPRRHDAIPRHTAARQHESQSRLRQHGLRHAAQLHRRSQLRTSQRFSLAILAERLGS